MTATFHFHFDFYLTGSTLQYIYIYIYWCSQIIIYLLVFLLMIGFWPQGRLLCLQQEEK
jgi:hypothetical protein